MEPPELAQSVEILLRLAEKSDRWRVPVTCLYVKTQRSPQARRSIRDLSEERYEKRNQAEHNALWRLYSLHRPLQKALKGVGAAELSTLLCEAVKRDPDAVPQALQLRSTLIAAKQNARAFTELPVDIVEEHIVPNILLTVLQADAAREPVSSATDAGLNAQTATDADFASNNRAAQQGIFCGAPPGYAGAPAGAPAGAAAAAATAHVHPPPPSPRHSRTPSTSWTRT